MKAAIFDMDGTILDSMSVWDGFGQDYLRTIAIEPPENLWQEIRAMSYIETANYFIKTFSLPNTPEELMKIWDDFVYERYERMAKLKPGVKEYIKKLYDSGTKICLATATMKFIARAMLEKFEIEKYFDFIITEEDVGAGKTEPDIYIEAAKRLGEAPSDCIVFEDSLHAIKTAKNAGFTVWGLLDPSASDHHEQIILACDKIFDFYRK